MVFSELQQINLNPWGLMVFTAVARTIRLFFLAKTQIVNENGVNWFGIFWMQLGNYKKLNGKMESIDLEYFCQLLWIILLLLGEIEMAAVLLIMLVQ
jgi:hypothetical protein